MTKAEFIAAIADESGESKAAATRVLEELAYVVTVMLDRRIDVTLPGIGRLTVKDRAATTGTNPRTGEPIEIAARKAVKFTAAKALKDAINPPAAPRKGGKAKAA